MNLNDVLSPGRDGWRSSDGHSDACPPTFKVSFPPPSPTEPGYWPPALCLKRDSYLPRKFAKTATFTLIARLER